jgi:hypothetical protein
METLMSVSPDAPQNLIISVSWGNSIGRDNLSSLGVEVGTQSPLCKEQQALLSSNRRKAEDRSRAVTVGHSHSLLTLHPAQEHPTLTQVSHGLFLGQQ